MRVMIVGGSGLLGSAAAAELLRRGDQVSIASRSGQPLDLPGLERLPALTMDVSTTPQADRRAMLAGFDAVVYAVGPDDRLPYPAPARQYLQTHLVQATRSTLQAGAEAGVGRAVVLGSYFCAWDREHPQLGFAARHPYVAARNEQAGAALAVGAQTGMGVNVLELPYIFGSASGRPGVFKEWLFDRVHRKATLYYPKGGSTVSTVAQVAQATVAAVSTPQTGHSWPIGEADWDWNHLLRVVADAMGVPRRIVNVPRPVAELGALQMAWDVRRHGHHSGMSTSHVMRDLMYQYIYVDHHAGRRALNLDAVDVAGTIARSVAMLYPSSRSVA